MALLYVNTLMIRDVLADGDWEDQLTAADQNCSATPTAGQQWFLVASEDTPDGYLVKPVGNAGRALVPAHTNSDNHRVRLLNVSDTSTYSWLLERQGHLTRPQRDPSLAAALRRVTRGPVLRRPSQPSRSPANLPAPQAPCKRSTMSGRKLPGLIAAVASAAIMLTCLPARHRQRHHRPHQQRRRRGRDPAASRPPPGRWRSAARPKPSPGRRTRRTTRPCR